MSRTNAKKYSPVCKTRMYAHKLYACLFKAYRVNLKMAINIQ